VSTSIQKRVARGQATLFALAISTACAPKPGPPDAGHGLLIDAGSPVVLELQIELRLPDGGTIREVLGPSPGPMVPVTQELFVTANLRLRNYRLRVLDEVDRALASDDIPEGTVAGLRYHISLLSPLRSGHRYTVLLDAQNGTNLEDGTGRTLDELRFDFHTAGEREKDTPVKRKPAKHKRHHPAE